MRPRGPSPADSKNAVVIAGPTRIRVGIRVAFPFPPYCGTLEIPPEPACRPDRGSLCRTESPLTGRLIWLPFALLLAVQWRRLASTLCLHYGELFILPRPRILRAGTCHGAGLSSASEGVVNCGRRSPHDQRGSLAVAARGVTGAKLDSLEVIPNIPILSDHSHGDHQEMKHFYLFPDIFTFSSDDIF